MEISWLYYAQPVVILVAIILYVIWRKLQHRKREKEKGLVPVPKPPN